MVEAVRCLFRKAPFPVVNDSGDIGFRGHEEITFLPAGPR